MAQDNIPALQQAQGRVATAPLDPAVHEELGDVWLDAGRPICAAACYRTAASLGEVSPELVLKLALAEAEAGRPAAALSRLRALREQAPDVLAEEAAAVEARCRDTAEIPLAAMDHNRHFRMATLAAFLKDLMGTGDFSLLDVGGGDGLLALHLPEAVYRLVEPGTNGLSGLSLPFPERSADVVCACHVFEHIPPAERFGFLDNLRAQARRHLVLLNPFRTPGDRREELLQLVLDLTGAAWAREHLECGLPDLSEVQEYAAARGLPCRIEPNGDLLTAFLGTLVGHYARRAGDRDDLGRINAYLNALDADLVTHPRLPAAMLVHFPLA